MIVSNSSPLIYLAKLKKVSLLKLLFREIIIPSQVYEEVVVLGKKEKFPDALLIEQARKESWLKVEEMKEDKHMTALSVDIDRGECAAILLAKKYRADLVLIDDASARIIAQSLGLRVKGTIFVLLSAYKKKIISKEEIKRLLARLIIEGFRISQELYVQVLEEIDKFKG